MNVTLVDKDTGRPLFVGKNRGRIASFKADGHQEVAVPIPRGLHDRSAGRFARWDFVRQVWETDTVKEQEHAQARDQVDNRRQDVADAYKALKAITDDPSHTWTPANLDVLAQAVLDLAEATAPYVTRAAPQGSDR